MIEEHMAKDTCTITIIMAATPPGAFILHCPGIEDKPWAELTESQKVACNIMQEVARATGGSGVTQLIADILTAPTKGPTP